MNSNTNHSDAAALPLGDRAIQFLMDFKWGILGLFGLIAVAGGIYGGVKVYKELNEKKASAALFSVQAELDKKLAEWDQKKEELANPIKPNPKDKTPAQPKEMPTFESLFGEIAKSSEPLILNYKGSKAASVAAISLSSAYLRYGMAEKASLLLSSVLEKVQRKEPFFGLISLQLGTALVDQGKSNDGIMVFSKALKSEQQKFLFPALLLKKALAEMKAGQKSEAKATFDLLIKEHGNTESARSAKSYLRLLSLNEKAS